MVVDSSVWIELLGGLPRAARCQAALSEASTLIVPTFVAFEVCRKLERQGGESSALEGMALLKQHTLAELSAEIALEAASLSIAHGLPAADSIVYAHARHAQAELLTLDNDFSGLPGVRLLR